MVFFFRIFCVSEILIWIRNTKIWLDIKFSLMAKRKKGKRVKVKGHYRVIIRDSQGRIISSKKWSPK